MVRGDKPLNYSALGSSFNGAAPSHRLFWLPIYDIVLRPTMKNRSLQTHTQILLHAADWLLASLPGLPAGALSLRVVTAQAPASPDPLSPTLIKTGAVVRQYHQVSIVGTMTCISKTSARIGLIAELSFVYQHCGAHGEGGSSNAPHHHQSAMTKGDRVRRPSLALPLIGSRIPNASISLISPHLIVPAVWSLSSPPAAGLWGRGASNGAKDPGRWVFSISPGSSLAHGCPIRGEATVIRQATTLPLQMLECGGCDIPMPAAVFGTGGG